MDPTCKLQVRIFSWAEIPKLGPSVAIKLMGPEEIHIYFLEGAPRPPKRKCDRPKNLEVFLVNFQNRYLSNVVVFSLCGGEGGGGSIEIRASSAQA